MYCGKFRKISRVKVIILSMIHGNEMSSAKNTAIILGTKVRVISWIWVAACSTLTRTPTPRPTPSMGRAMTRVNSMD